MNYAFAITTFLRPNSFKNCLESVREFYPDIPIYVADDSDDQSYHDNPDYELISLPFNQGISVKRNVIAQQAKEDILIYFDDDFALDDKEAIEKLITPVWLDQCDLCAGSVANNGEKVKYEGRFYQNGNTLEVQAEATHIKTNYLETDLVQNFFAAKRSTLLLNAWDDDLKIGEHIFFFHDAWKTGMRVWWCNDSVIPHVQEENARYMMFRDTFRKYQLEGMKKRGISELINHINGSNIKL